jgi:serine protease inhibitor
MNGVELSVANALWISTSFKVNPGFVQRAQELLSEARNIDFSSPQAPLTINSWVEDKTKNKIKDLLSTGYCTTV